MIDFLTLKLKNYLNSRTEQKRLSTIRDYWQNYTKRQGISQDNKGNL
jgi:site-specific recombinase XerD